MKTYDLVPWLDSIEEAEGMTGGFVLTEDAVPLMAALRVVQYEHSRGHIYLDAALEQRIIDLIGPHPRDGGGA